MRFLSALVALAFAAAGVADETDPILGYAVMRRDRAIQEDGGLTFALPARGATYYSPKASATGYLIVFPSGDGEPGMAVLPFRDEYGHPTARAWLYDSTMETNTVVVDIPAPLKPGYIPLIRGEKYPIVASDDGSYTLRYEFHGLVRTVKIDADEAGVELPSRPETDPRKIREKEMEGILERLKAEEKVLQERLAKSKENAVHVGLLLKQIGKAGVEKRRMLAEIAKFEATYNELLGYEAVTGTADALAAELEKISKRHGELAARLETGSIEADALKVLYTLLIRIDADLERIKTDVTAKLAEIQGMVGHYGDDAARGEREKGRELLRRAREQLSGYQVQVKHLETQREMLAGLYEQLTAARAALDAEEGRKQELTDAIDAIGDGPAQGADAGDHVPVRQPAPPVNPTPPADLVPAIDPADKDRPVDPPAAPPVTAPVVDPVAEPVVDPVVEQPPVKVVGTMIDAMDTAAGWFVEDWGDSAKIAIDIEDRLQVDFTVGAKGKVAVSKHFADGLNLDAADTIVVDVENRIKEAVQVAVALYLGPQWKYYESKPFFVRPGRYEVYFNMAARTFKSESSNWEYKDSPGGAVRTGKISLLIFSPKPGQLFYDNLRLESPAK